jgi:hypothetical protein
MNTSPNTTDVILWTDGGFEFNPNYEYPMPVFDLIAAMEADQAFWDEQTTTSDE